jgi:hypothetical protein
VPQRLTGQLASQLREFLDLLRRAQRVRAEQGGHRVEFAARS